MLTISNYQITKQLYESTNSLVYRGFREKDNQPVILKVLKEEYPTSEELRRYRQEYDITGNLKNLAGVINVYSLEQYQNTLVMCLEDFGGESLKYWLTERQLNLDSRLMLAIQITEILGHIHQQNIIHKDINPANIVWNPQSEVLKIIDFGISTQLSKQHLTLKNPEVLEGTLAYLSPEQTGRMNRALDYRTDFYSLGATFYELFTGKVPFESPDAMELVHCHIAKQPTPPHQLNPELPSAIAHIILKLLEKTAETRYQSAWGIKADLQECLAAWHQTGTIKPFTLAQQDIFDRFQVSQKLYGREPEIDTLLTAFERVADGQTEIMLVAGYSGVGKSVLVKEIYRSLTDKQGYFISGKFEQFQRNIPYSAVVNAFKELVQQLLTESEEQLMVWKKKLLTALGANGQIIIEVIPEIEWIIGAQPTVSQLGPTESQNRFNLVFQNFMRVFCNPEHPLVIFLDDLQWVDSATLKLLELIMIERDNTALFLIGAYRDNEVDLTHSLMTTLNQIREKQITINQITLKPLTFKCINQLISDSLHQNLKAVGSLTALVMDKTGGNPFFVNQFLRTLYEENLLHFILPTPEQKGHWQWDIAQIETLDITDNVVELMISKLKKLPQSVQQVLRLAACVGNHFDLDTLSVIYEKSVTDTFQDLMPVLTEELILPLSEFEMSSHDLHNSKFIIQHLRFLHDRVQQAAYALIDDEQKQAVHLQIGRLLFKNTSAKALEEKLFDILVHFNRSIKLLTHQVERLTVAQLNLMAGQKAKIATAYEAAIIYLTIGQECLTQNSWESKYDLTFNLYIEALETTYLNTHFEQIDTLSEIILQNTQSILDKAKVYEIKIQRYISQNQMQSALELGLATIKMLSISLSESPPQKVAIEKLYDLPKMTDPNKLMALRILRIIFPPAQITNPPLVLPIAFTMVQLCHDFGNSPLSAYAYILYGLVLCGPLGDIDSGYQFGKLALEMLKQFEAPEIKCEVICMFNFFVRHWKEAVNETVKPLPANIQLSLETGNIPYFSYTTMLYCQNLVLIGEPLFSVYQKQEAYIGLVQKFKQTYQLYNSSIWGQLVLNLSSKIQEQSQSLLIGELFDETNILPLLLQGENATTLFRFYLAKTILCYFLRNFTEAIANAVRAEEREKALKSTICVTQNSFYYSLALLAHYSMSTKNEQQEYLEKVETNQKKMQVWAFHAPMNFQHKYDLVEAEKARILGQHWSAAQLYEQAIVGAEKNQYLHEEALAYELAAEFYLACNMDKFAKTYLREAHYRYQQWGAIIKVADLQKRYPQFIDDTSSRQKTNYSTTITNSTLAQTTSQTNANWLDLNSVLKASQTLSGEMVLSRLLEKMMRIIIENAGAEKGFLLLLKQNNWFIEAEGCIDSDKVIVLQSLAIETSEQVPKPIIDYVARTLKKVVLPDATQVGNFTNISYIVKQRPKSLLCAPLLNRGQLTGILYLENNLITGAFTPERTELLNLLSSQIAISIENACLYTSITRFLPSEFLSLLNKKNIIDVQLGDQVEKEMSILFSDVRGFTALSEKMTPQENFDFINAYLSRMAPIIAQHNGFIDKYIGDAIMALFPGGANDAVNASIAMLKKLTAYNQKRHKLGLEPIAIGIGLNTGLLMLGTVGGENRMDGTVISDAVNLASRIEGMSKMYGAALLISEATYIHLSDASQYAIRTIDRVRVKGKLAPVTIYEVFDGDLPHLVDLKMKTLENFEEGLAYYRQQALTEAIPYFEDVLNLNPDDKVAQIYLNRCRHWQQIGVPDGWDGIEVLDSK